ncbi:MAG: hypothetical protein L6V84_01705 [Oscillospiraceae bacterium]|nr:MAG: hypothetical protein L6V84_01705 [Oscillospiraceae bacterium]
MIQESMESPQFNTGEKTLIIQCEEGMDELDISTFNGKNVYLETVENESDLTPDLLSAMAKKHKLDRILIEYNGMWMLSTLYDAMPQKLGYLSADDVRRRQHLPQLQPEYAPADGGQADEHRSGRAQPHTGGY